MKNKMGAEPLVRYQRLCTAVLFAVFSVSLQAADIHNGRDVYQKHCEQCHDVDGRGMMPTMPDFSRAERLLTPDTQLYSTIRSGKGIMPGYEGVLDKQEILDVIVYLRTFYR